MSGSDTGQAIRVDKWLWYARQVKSRSLAQKLVSGGNVRVNRQRISSPNKQVRPGDVLTIALANRIRVLKILACGSRRGPFSEASQLYEDLSPPLPVRQEVDHASDGKPLPEGRPDSRGRRLARKLSGRE